MSYKQNILLLEVSSQCLLKYLVVTSAETQICSPRKYSKTTFFETTNLAILQPPNIDMKCVVSRTTEAYVTSFSLPQASNARYLRTYIPLEHLKLSYIFLHYPVHFLHHLVHLLHYACIMYTSSTLCMHYVYIFYIMCALSVHLLFLTCGNGTDNGGR